MIFSSILQIWYVELRISRSISKSPLEFEITRVDCIWINQVTLIHFHFSIFVINILWVLIRTASKHKWYLKAMTEAVFNELPQHKEKKRNTDKQLVLYVYSKSYEINILEWSTEFLQKFRQNLGINSPIVPKWSTYNQQQMALTSITCRMTYSFGQYSRMLHCLCKPFAVFGCPKTGY